MSIPADLLNQVMELDPEARADLAHRLLLSLEPEGVPRDPGYEEAWAVEIEERVRRFEADPSRARPADEVLERIRRGLRRGRGQ